MSITTGKAMSIYRSRVSIAILFATLLGCCPLRAAQANSPSVTAVLGNSEAAVGQMVHLQIRLSGARSGNPPNEIAVDGLEIRQTGTEQHFEMNNLSVTQSVNYNYTILPLKPGTFKIPPQTVQAGSRSLRTPELTLHVVASQNRQAAPNSAGSSDVDTSKLVTAELIVPKKTAYVGEMIPVVFRVVFFGRGQPAGVPEINAQGFTMQKLQPPDRRQVETINGRRCEVWTFKNAIAATRPGKFDLGPAPVEVVVLVPRQHPRSNRPRSPFDLFDRDDPFDDPFANPFGQEVKMTVKSESAPLEVKPLPPNPPANFGGAVGNFSMTVDANPKSVQVGDPITVTSTITGRGNFDRINAPAVEDEHGWHKYPPSAKFTQDDDVGISGAKNFEMVLSPNEKKQSIPPFVFSYFDPAKENYVTLRSEPIPIRVEGGAVAATTPAPSVAPSQPGSATPATAAAKPTPKPQDILDQLTERPARSQSFTPLYARSSFWFAQIIPFLALVGFVGWKVRQSRLGDREAQRTAALQHEAAELMRNLRRGGSSPQEYFSQASRAVQLKTALARHVDPNTVDAETAATTFRLDENSRAQLQQLFERSDEMRYSGARNGAGGLSAESRRDLLDLIESLRA
jgi:hypothetical protein